jgi:hypothetical protein
MLIRYTIFMLLITTMLGCSSPDDYKDLLAEKIQFELPEYLELAELEILDELTTDVNNDKTTKLKFKVSVVPNEVLFSPFIETIRGDGMRHMYTNVAYEEGEKVELTGTATFNSDGYYYGAAYDKTYPTNLGVTKTQFEQANENNGNILFGNSPEFIALKSGIEASKLAEDARRKAADDAKKERRRLQEEERLAEDQERDRTRALAEQTKLDAEQAAKDLVIQTKESFVDQFTQTFKANGQVVVTQGARRANTLQAQFFNQERTFKILRNIKFEDDKISGESWDLVNVNAVPFELTWREARSWSQEEYQLDYVEHQSPEAVIWGNNNIRDKKYRVRLEWDINENKAAKSNVEIDLDEDIQAKYTQELNKLLPPWGSHNIKQGPHIIVDRAIYELESSTFVGYIAFNIGGSELTASSEEHPGGFLYTGSTDGESGVAFTSSYPRATYAKKDPFAVDIDFYQVVSSYEGSAVYFSDGDYFYASNFSKLNEENFLAETKKLTDLGVFTNPRGRAGLWGNYFYANRVGQRDIIDRIDVRDNALTQLEKDNPLISSDRQFNKATVLKFDPKTGMIAIFDLKQGTITNLDASKFALIKKANAPEYNVLNFTPVGPNILSFFGGRGVVFVDTQNKKLFAGSPEFKEVFESSLNLASGSLVNEFRADNWLRISPSQNRILLNAYTNVSPSKQAWSQNKLTRKSLVYDVTNKRFVAEVTNAFKELVEDQGKDYRFFDTETVTWISDSHFVKTVTNHPDIAKIGLWMHNIETNKTVKVISKMAQYCGFPRYFGKLNTVLYCKKEPDGSQTVASFNPDGTQGRSYPLILFKDYIRLIN